MKLKYHILLNLKDSKTEEKLLQAYDVTKYPVECTRDHANLIEMSDNFLHSFDVIYTDLTKKNLSFLNVLQKKRPELLIVVSCDDQNHLELDRKIIHFTSKVSQKRIETIVAEINRRMRELGEHNELLGTSELIKMLSSDLNDLDELFEKIQTYIDTRIPASFFQVCSFLKRNGEKRKIFYQSHSKKSFETKEILNEVQDHLDSDIDHKSSFLSFYEKKSKLVVTFNLGLYNEQPLLGQVITDRREVDNCFQVFNELFYKVVSRALGYLDMTEFQIHYKQLAHQDDVTGLYNQRKLFLDIDNLIAQKKIFSVLFVDVDDFKIVNDRYGHLVGSDILIKLASLFKDSIRQTDYFYRYGGDEFIIILSETNAQHAKSVAERLLKKIKDYSFAVPSPEAFYQLSASIGISEYPKDAKSAQEIISIADEMMYNSKKAGKGRVIHTK